MKCSWTQHYWPLLSSNLNRCFASKAIDTQVNRNRMLCSNLSHWVFSLSRLLYLKTGPLVTSITNLMKSNVSYRSDNYTILIQNRVVVEIVFLFNTILTFFCAERTFGKLRGAFVCTTRLIICANIFILCFFTGNQQLHCGTIRGTLFL